MLAQKTFWIQSKTSRAYESMDPEEHAALVSIMRHQAKFCGINILTYQIEYGNLSMLVSCPSRDHHLEYFRDRENEPRGSGMARLFHHLRQIYTASHVQSLADEYDSLIQHGEDTQPFITRYTRRLGVPKKFAEAINEAFARWVKKNRPQLYEKVGGNVCRKEIYQTYLDTLHKQREIAVRMDASAVKDDDGSEPRQYWCGFSDALRGDEDALDGLRELMRAPAESAEKIKELGYCSQPVYSSSSAGSSSMPDTASKKSSTRRSSHKKSGSLLSLTAPPMDDEPLEPPKPMSQEAKQKFVTAAIALMAVLLGLGVFLGIREWNKYSVNKQAVEAGNSDTAPEEPPNGELSPQSEELTAQPNPNPEQALLAKMTAQLYDKEARQLAEDFGKCMNPEIRLRMCRQPDKIRKHMAHYTESALTEPASEVTFMDVVDLGGIMAARFVAKFNNSSSRLICVVPTAAGLKIDWDCYARYNNEAVRELLDGQIKSAELRVFVKRSDYYNFSFRDHNRWMSFEVNSPDFEDAIYVYCQRNTTTGKMLDSAIPTSAVGKSVQMTIQVSSNHESYRRKQFTLDRVYSFGWVRAALDIEDQYRSRLDTIAR